MALKVKIIFFSLLSLNINLFPEYFVFKKDKNLSILPISEKEHEFVYEILLKYQWPMSIANTDRTNLAKYTLAEAGPIEENFIRAKIQEKFKDLDVVFIPTLVYELFCLANKKLLYSVEKSVYRAFSDNGILDNETFVKYLNSRNATLDGVYEKFRAVNSLKEVENGHYLINNLLIEFFVNILKEKYFIKNLTPSNIASSIRENIDKIIETELPELSGERFKYIPINLLNFDKITFNVSIFKNIVAQEYESHAQNYGLIYRVTESDSLTYIPGKGLIKTLELTQLHGARYNLTDSELDYYKKLMDLDEKIKRTDKLELALINDVKKRTAFLFNEPSRSISYGNSIFAGLSYDEGASLFYYYIKNENTSFYGLKINKFAYKKRTAPIGDSYLLFTITPLSNLASLFATGEFFHPRSKSYYFDSGFKSIKGILTSGRTSLVQDNAGYILFPGNTIEMNAKLSDYITKNAIVFRPADKIEAKKLMDGQKDVTDLFKSMDVIYKYAKRDEKILK